MRGSILGKLPAYWRFRRGQGSLEIGYPWLTIGAVCALERILHKASDFSVLELGGGGSTVFFSNRVAAVTTLETDPLWAVAIHDALTNRRARVICVPYAQLNSHVEQEQDESYDIAVIDHANPGQRRPDRLGGAIAAAPKVKPGGWLVLDNYNEYGLQNFDYAGWEVWTFDDLRHTGKGTRICRKSTIPQS